MLNMIRRHSPIAHAAYAVAGEAGKIFTVDPERLAAREAELVIRSNAELAEQKKELESFLHERVLTPRKEEPVAMLD